MTKREMFNLIATVNSDNEEIVAFCQHEIEVLEARANHKTPTKTQKENEILLATLETVLSALTEPTTVTDLINNTPELNGYSNQKISALLRKMVESGKVVKTIEKKKAYFAIA